LRTKDEICNIAGGMYSCTMKRQKRRRKLPAWTTALYDTESNHVNRLRLHCLCIRTHYLMQWESHSARASSEYSNSTLLITIAMRTQMSEVYRPLSTVLRV